MVSNLSPSLTLDEAPTGAKVRIISIIGGHGVVSRLMQMGLIPGSIVEILNNNAGPVIVRVRGITIALGRGMAKKILVERVY